jgi:uncharacterized protein (TIGR03083 family)
MPNFNAKALTTYPLDIVSAHLSETCDCFSQVLHSLTPDEWDVRSRCPGWTIADVAMHLAEALAIYSQGCSIGTQPPYATLTRPSQPDELVSLFQREADTLLDWLSAVPPTLAVRHPHYIVPPATLGAIALSEVLLHGWDVADPLRRPWQPAPDAAASVLAHLFPSRMTSDNPWRRLLHVSGRLPEAGRDDFPGSEWDWELVSVYDMPAQART